MSKPKHKQWTVKTGLQTAAPAIFAGVVLAILGFSWANISSEIAKYFGPPHEQQVTWISGSDANLAGLKVSTKDGSFEKFVPWAELRTELNERLLPFLFKNPSGFQFEMKDFGGKPRWLVNIVDADGKGFCHVWLGKNPEEGFKEDGLVRVGGDKLPIVWQTYQRYSDGRYTRLKSAFRTLEEACPPEKRPCIRD